MKEALRHRTGHSELNVIRTMVLVSVSFALCFFCMRTYSILTRLDIAPGVVALYSLFSVFSYSNRLLNPFIYATQYEIVRRWWKIVALRVLRRQHVEEASVTASDVKDITTSKEPAARSRATTRNL